MEPFDVIRSRMEAKLEIGSRVWTNSATGCSWAWRPVLQSWTRAPRVYALIRSPVRSATQGWHRQPGRARGIRGDRRQRAQRGQHARPAHDHRPAGLKKDKSHPTLLQGYGAYGVVNDSDPTFTPALIPWIEPGGIRARCHVRRCGDYGEEWHRAGQRRNNGEHDLGLHRLRGVPRHAGLYHPGAAGRNRWERG
jgi:hypothetical protein